MILIIIFLLFLIQYSLSEEWTIHVYTGTERFAGTDSNIYLRLFDSKTGYTQEYELTHENWIIGNDMFPLKNLFEYGGHDRFRIATKTFALVEKIHVRRDNFPLLQSDWFLDRIVVERNRDSTKFIFKCNCWLRKEQLFITIPVLSDSRSIDKNNLSKDNLTIVVILIVSIALITCSICCILEYCRRREFSFTQIPHESLIVDRYHPQLPAPSAPPPLLNNHRNSWDDIFHSNDNSRVVIVQSTDEPPAYNDLFPN